MSCFSACFGGGDRKAKQSASRKDADSVSFTRSESKKSDPKPKSPPPPIETTPKENGNGSSGNINAKSFTFRELATATKNFRPDSLLGEGGFGRVYKGCFESTGQIVAIKQLDRNGSQGNKEFLVEVLMLSLLHHQNLVNLIGYCADGDQRLLVYEFMPSGSVEDHLLDIPLDRKPLSWQSRMKIASGAAQGLDYLHDKANPPVIYRDLKSSNILLDEDLNPRLSDFGLAKLGPRGSCTLPISSMMGTYGYCAPEYGRNGELTVKCDVYSFGVILLELITGRRVIDASKPMNEQNLVTWAQPMFKDQKKFPQLVDPRLEGDYPVKALNQAVGVAAMCLQEEPSVRPFMADVVMALGFLMNAPPDTPPGGSTPMHENHAHSDHSDHDSSDEESIMDHEDETAEASEDGSASSSRSHSISGRRHGSQHERHDRHESDSE